MQKNFLKLCAAATILLSAATTAHAVDYVPVQRNHKWTATTCGSAPADEGGGNGGDISKMLDHDDSTYWMSNWSQTSERYGSGHYFVIDLGESVEFDAISYTPIKTTETNISDKGVISELVVYVSNTPFTNLSHGMSSYSGSTPILEAKNINATVNGPTITLPLSQRQSGQYLLCFPKSTYSGASVVSCAEFDLLYDPDYGIANVDANNAYIDLFAPFFTPEQIAALKETHATTINIDDIATDIASKINGAIVDIEHSAHPGYYLAHTGKLVQGKSEDTKWILNRVGNTKNFYFTNLSGQSLSCNGTSSSNFYIVENTSENPGIAFRFIEGDTSHGIHMNADNLTSNVTHWEYYNHGSSWQIHVASVDASTITSGYYRIRSTKLVGSAQSYLSLQGVKSVGQDFATEAVKLSDNGIGSVWHIDTDEQGHHTFTNLIAHPENEPLHISGQKLQLSGGTYAPYFIKNPQSGNYKYAISSSSTTNNLATVLIKNENYNGSVLQNGYYNSYTTWNDVSFYFEPVSDDEVAALSEAYIASANANGAKDSDRNYFNGYEALFGENYDAEYQEALNAFTGDAETIAEANMLYLNAADGIAEAKAEHAILIAQKADGAMVCFSVSGASLIKPVYLGANESSLAAMDVPYHLGNIWNLTLNENGKYLMHNHGHQHYIATEGAVSASADEAIPVQLNLIGSGKVTLTVDREGKNSLAYTTGIGFENESNEWAQWTPKAVTIDDTEVTFEAESADGLITALIFRHPDDAFLEGNAHPGSHKMTIDIYADAASSASVMSDETEAESPLHIELNNVTTENGAIKITPADAGLESFPAGNYEISIPMGFIMNSDQFMAAQTLSYSVAANGSTTGIEEIEGDVAPAVDAIYDLQGHRLAAPAKGINIINGRKVLVK